MSTTQSYAYNPAASNLTLIAFGRIGIRRTEITAQHMADADNEANLLQVTLANSQPNLWRSELYQIPLVEGTAAYNLPVRMVAIQALYIATTVSGVSTDRVIWPLSTYEYSALPNKTQQAPPTAYWVDKTIIPTITFWQVPDGNATYTANVRLLSQAQDVSLVSGTTLDMPYRYLDVFVAGLAHRLARIYAPDKEALRKQDYQDAWAVAATTDTQDSVGLYISPSFAGYWS